MTPIIERLRAHGIEARRLTRAWTGRAESFTVDSIVKGARPFQGHTEVRLEGRWSETRLTLPRGTWLVSGRQALALVAAIMLEPQSDDGLTTWNFLDARLVVGGPHPVRRALDPIAAAR